MLVTATTEAPTVWELPLFQRANWKTGDGFFFCKLAVDRSATISKEDKKPSEAIEPAYTLLKGGNPNKIVETKVHGRNLEWIF